MKYCQSTIIALLALLFILYGCSDEQGCYDSVDTKMVASFKVSDFRVFDTLIIHGVGRNTTGDTLVNDTLSSQSKRFSLPLSLSEDSTGFVILAGGIRDTVYIHHLMKGVFISEYCGFAPEYSIQATSFTSGIDSIQISDAVVNTKSLEKNIDDQNITIYFNFTVN